MNKREQVAQQYRAVAHLAGHIAIVHTESSSVIPEAPDGVIDIMGARSARLMEVFGDILNGMDATDTGDEWIDPIYDEAHLMFPQDSAQPSLPVEAAGPTQRELNIKNLRFYADMFRQHEWSTVVIHWGVFEQTLNEIADRIAAVPAPPADTAPQSSGISLIAAERQRQVSAEGWSAAHDDEHDEQEMVMAAESYSKTNRLSRPPWNPPQSWPWDRKWWKPSDDPVRNLVKSGALIAAEIDRLQRLRGIVQPPADTAPRELPSVAGNMEHSISEHKRACQILIADEQRKPLPDNHLIATLCDSVRMGREYVEYAQSKPLIQAPTDTREPAQTTAIQTIYSIATRELAEPGIHTGTLSAICTLIESGPWTEDPGKPAEPVREWRARHVDFNKTATVRLFGSAQERKQFAQLNPDFVVQFSIDSRITWQDADTRAAEGTK